MIEIPEWLMEIHEAQAPSITDETLDKHYTKRKKKKKKKRNCHTSWCCVAKPKKIKLNYYYYYYYFKHQPNRDSEKEEIGGWRESKTDYNEKQK